MYSQAVAFCHKQAQQTNPCITLIIADYVTSSGLSDLWLQRVQTCCFISNKGGVKQPRCNIPDHNDDFKWDGNRFFIFIFFPLLYQTSRFGTSVSNRQEEATLHQLFRICSHGVFILF